MAPDENNKTMDLDTTQNEDSVFSSTDKSASDDLTIVEKTERESNNDQEEDLTDEPDETLWERILGLTEMFPESVRNTTYTVSMNTKTGMETFYSLSRSAIWIAVSASVILFAPLIFEVERAQMEDMQRSQQKQVPCYLSQVPTILLGPHAAVSSGLPLPPMPR